MILFIAKTFSRAKSSTSNRQSKQNSSNQSKRNAAKSSSRQSYSKRISSARKKDVEKENIILDDDLDQDDEFDVDVGMVNNERLENTHRKPAVRISPNNPVMV